MEPSSSRMMKSGVICWATNSKQNSGVQVNLIYDSVGHLLHPRVFKPLRESGANVLEFNPINPLIVQKDWQFTWRDHVSFDSRRTGCFCGWYQYSSVYSSGHSADQNRPETIRHGEILICVWWAQLSVNFRSCLWRHGVSKKASHCI